MKRMHAWITGGLLTAALVTAPAVQANEDHDRAQNVRYYNGAGATVAQGTYENGNYYVNVNGQRVAWPSSSVMISEPGGMFVSRNGQLYYVQDDPRYDLSGAGNTIMLLDNGSAFKTGSSNVPVAFAAAGGGTREVVTLPAEYRQHWLAVAAGDRPVRNLKAVPMAPQGPTMTFVPVTFARDRARMDEEREARAANGAYRNGHASAKKASARKRNGHHKSSATVASRNGYRTNAYRANGSTVNGSRTNAYRANGYRANGYRANGSTVNGSRTNGYRANGYPTNGTTYNAESSDRTRVGSTFERVEEQTRNLYQVGGSWYQREGDTWSRSDSWRGPFVSVSDDMVPREVRTSEKEPFKD